MNSYEIKMGLNAKLHQNSSNAASLETHFNGDIKYQMSPESYQEKMSLISDLKLEVKHAEFQLGSASCLSCPDALTCSGKTNSLIK